MTESKGTEQVSTIVIMLCFLVGFISLIIWSGGKILKEHNKRANAFQEELPGKQIESYNQCLSLIKTFYPNEKLIKYDDCQYMIESTKLIVSCRKDRYEICSPKLWVKGIK